MLVGDFRLSKNLPVMFTSMVILVYPKDPKAKHYFKL